MSTQKLYKNGNSVAVTIPKDILKKSKLDAGASVHIQLDESTGAIIVSSSENPFKGLSPDIAEWTKKFIDKNREALAQLAKA